MPPAKRQTQVNSRIRTEEIASDWLRVLRGKRSQNAMSRRLGYKSNVAYRWETGRAWPSASKTFRAIERLGGNVRRSLVEFYRHEPPWLDNVDPRSRAGVAALLRDLRGTTSIVDLAERTGFSRFAISRWLKGNAEPLLPEFLTVVEATSLRLVDFVSVFVDPELLPSLRSAWQQLRDSREAAYSAPWSHAVLRSLELDAYRKLTRHRRGWIGKRLGIPVEEEERCLGLLQRGGQIRWNGRRYTIERVQVVDTRADPNRARELKGWWTQVGLDRLNAGAPGIHSYNLSAVSRRDLERVVELHRAYYREMSGIIAQSKDPECVILFGTQVLELDGA